MRFLRGEPINGEIQIHTQRRSLATSLSKDVLWPLLCRWLRRVSEVSRIVQKGMFKVVQMSEFRKEERKMSVKVKLKEDLSAVMHTTPRVNVRIPRRCGTARCV